MVNVLNLFKGRSLFAKWVSEYLLASPHRMILLSFLLVIFLGTAMLMFPAATIHAGSLNFIDALFTATSATCVTGLVVTDTAQTFSLFGQLIILFLIQVGGLGIMTFSTFFIFLFVGKLSISGRNILVDTLSQNPILQLVRLLWTVFLFTIVLEFAGWIFLSLKFFEDHSLSESLYLGIFHSISAFCNAGFTLLGNSYIDYNTDIYFNLVNIILIISGGLGFIVIFDISTQVRAHRKHFFERLSLHTKIALLASGILIVGGALVFYLFEASRGLKAYGQVDKVIIAAFQSVTTRTAGFSTVEISDLTQPTLYFIVILMFIGASPGSCGGGIKTTTFALVIPSLMKQFSNNKDINAFSRRIPEDTISKAASIVFFAVFTIGIFVFLLSITEVYFAPPGEARISMMDILFEVVSAFGTVGLSTGITETLSPAGKLLISLLMYLGRLGPLTLVLALKSKETSKIRYMKEDILVG